MFDRKIVHRADILPVNPGQRYTSALDNNVRTHGVELTVEADLAIGTNPAAAIRNRGSLLAAIAFVGLRMDGENRIIADGRSLGALQDLMGRLPRRYVRATSTAVGAYALRESVVIPGAMFGLAVPSETALTEENTQIPVEAFVELTGVPAAAIATAGGGGTVALTNIRVRVSHLSDTKRSDLPLFRPITREIVTNIPAAGDFEISLRGNSYMAAVLLQQDTDLGEQTDVLNSVKLLGDAGYSIIQQAMPWQHFVNTTSPFGFDGAPVTGYGYGVVNFIGEGKLSHLLHPAVAPNLRLVVNAQPSVVVGATNSKIRATIIEMERHSRLTAPALPFNV